MNLKIEQWREGWQGISMGLSNEEVDHFIKLLQEIREDNEQHFHISSDCKGSPSIGGIEIYIKSNHENDNMRFSSLALAPGSELP